MDLPGASDVGALLLKMSEAELGRVDSSLLRLQHALSTCAVPNSDDTCLLERYLSAVRAGTFQTTIFKTMGISTPRLQKNVSDMAQGMGIGGLDECGEGAIRTTALYVDGELMGTVYLRDIKRVIFYMLAQATSDNFRTEPELLVARDGSREYADKLTLDTGKTIHAEVQRKAAVVHTPRLRELVKRNVLQVSPLLLTHSSDATAHQTTTEATYDGYTLTSANLKGPWGSKRGAKGLLALMPVFKNPHDPKKNRLAYLLYKRRAQIAHHMALDEIYSAIYSVRSGFLWELFPNFVVHFLPRTCGRAGDHPKQQAEIGQKTSAMSNGACRFCLLLGCRDLCRARVYDSKLVVGGSLGELSIAAAARVGPQSPPADRRKVLAFGSSLLGRTPAPFTERALAVSSHSPSDLVGALGLLHTLTGLAKTLVMMLTQASRRILALLHDEASIAALEERIGDLLSYCGCASYILPLKSGVLYKRVPSKQYMSAILLLPALLEGILEEEVWKKFSDACLALHRLNNSLQQTSISHSSSTRISKEAIVAFRSLMHFENFFLRIKAHHLLHYGERIPRAGPPRYEDEAPTEAHNMLIQLLAKLTKGGAGQAHSMLRKMGFLELLGLLAQLRKARSPAVPDASLPQSAAAGGAAGPAGAQGAQCNAFPPTSIAGRLCTLPTTTEVPVTKCCTMPDHKSLPGFVPTGIADGSATAYLAGGRKSPEAARVRGQQGAPLGEASSPVSYNYRKTLTLELCFRLVGAEEPPVGTSAAVRATQRAWQDKLLCATASHKWRGAALESKHFKRSGAEGRCLSLTPSGQQQLVERAGITVSDLLRYGGVPGSRPPPRSFPAASPVCPTKSSTTTLT